jgi:hypothetical protein
VRGRRQSARPTFEPVGRSRAGVLVGYGAVQRECALGAGRSRGDRGDHRANDFGAPGDHLDMSL